jgi:hypothetical protein
LPEASTASSARSALAPSSLSSSCGPSAAPRPCPCCCCCCCCGCAEPCCVPCWACRAPADTTAPPAAPAPAPGGPATPDASHTACRSSTDSTADLPVILGLPPPPPPPEPEPLLVSASFSLRMNSRGVLETSAMRMRSASSPTITARSRRRRGGRVHGCARVWRCQRPLNSATAERARPGVQHAHAPPKHSLCVSLGATALGWRGRARRPRIFTSPSPATVGPDTSNSSCVYAGVGRCGQVCGASQGECRLVGCHANSLCSHPQALTPAASMHTRTHADSALTCCQRCAASLAHT